MRYIVFFTALLGLLCVLMAACSPQRRLARLASTHPADIAEICGRMFPVKESNVVRIRTVRDTLLQRGETVYVDCDSAVFHRPAAPGVRILVPVKCPDQLHIIDTVFRDSVVTLENTAALTSMTDKKDKAEIKAAGLKSNRDTWRWAALGLGAYFIIRLVLRHWLKISLP